jgi:excisionase family DNA binding protein
LGTGRKKLRLQDNILGGKTDSRDGPIGALATNSPERRRLTNTDHDRFQGETDGPTWLTYEQAARYAGWSVGHLRNLVSAGQVPVYGIRRRRRFRRDMLDLFLTDPDMAMRRFSAEGNSSHGR